MKSRNKGQSRVHSLYRRIACFFFAFIMVSMTVMMNSNTSLAATKETTSKATTSKAIAIVFDNSGTMYSGKNTAWSRAIYAMEVFASMANKGDKIWIYPMNPIKIASEDETKTYTNSEPLKLEGGEDAVDKIKNIYTPEKGGDTPIEAITNAYKGLTGNSEDNEFDVDEKWLIVLTDGDKKFGFYEGGEQLSEEDPGKVSEDRLTHDLSEYSKKVNVMYLGIENEEEIISPEIEGSSLKNPVRIASSSDEILETLTDMCNDIYGRDKMETDGKTVDFDGLTMTKLILFVQGNNISGLSLKNEDGNKEVAENIYEPSHTPPDVHEKDGDKDALIDETLSGQIAIYENLPAGKYTVDYNKEEGSNANVTVYYEPDVSIGVRLLNEKDEDITTPEAAKADENYPGNYTLEYGLKDSEGNFTASELLGKREIDVTCSVTHEDGSNDPVPIEHWTAEAGDEANAYNSIEIPDLKEGDSVNIQMEATYLGGYRVSSDSLKDFPSKIDINATPPFELSANIEADSSYTISDLDSDKAEPIKVNITHDGEKLSEEEMSGVTLKLTLNNEESLCDDWTVTKDEENSRYEIYPKIDSSETGTYELQAHVTYLDEYEKPNTADSDKKSISFTLVPTYVWFIAAGLILLIILAIILIIMNQKVLPKKMKAQEFDFKVGSRKVTGDAEVSYKGGRRSANLVITSPTDANGIYCTINIRLSAVDPRRTSSRERRVRITGVNPDEFITNLEVGSASFKRNREGELKRTDIVIDSEDQNGFSAFETGSGWEISMKGKVKAQGSTKDVSLSAIIEHQ